MGAWDADADADDADDDDGDDDDDDHHHHRDRIAGEQVAVYVDMNDEKGRELLCFEFSSKFRANNNGTCDFDI